MCNKLIFILILPKTTMMMMIFDIMAHAYVTQIINLNLFTQFKYERF